MSDTVGNTDGDPYGLGLSPADQALFEETIGIMFGLDIIFPDYDEDDSLDDGERG